MWTRATRSRSVRVAEQVGDDRDPPACASPAPSAPARSLRSGCARVDDARDLADHAAPRARRHDAHASAIVGHRDADGIAVRVHDRGEPDGDLARRAPLLARRDGKRHRRRRVEHDRRRQNRAVGREPDVRAVAAREQSPVDPARIVALTIEPVLGELGRRAALLASDACRRARRSPHGAPASARLARHRAARRTTHRSSRLHPNLAARRLDAREQIVDDPLDARRPPPRRRSSAARDAAAPAARRA